MYVCQHSRCLQQRNVKEHCLRYVLFAQQVRYPENLDIRPFMSESRGEPEVYGALPHSGHYCDSGHYCSHIKVSHCPVSSHNTPPTLLLHIRLSAELVFFMFLIGQRWAVVQHEWYICERESWKISAETKRICAILCQMNMFLADLKGSAPFSGFEGLQSQITWGTVHTGLPLPGPVSTSTAFTNLKRTLRELHSPHITTSEVAWSYVCREKTGVFRDGSLSREQSAHQPPKLNRQARDNFQSGVYKRSSTECLKMPEMERSVTDGSEADQTMQKMLVDEDDDCQEHSSKRRTLKAMTRSVHQSLCLFMDSKDSENGVLL